MSTPTAMGSTSRRGIARWSVAAVATGALVVSGSGLVAFAQSGVAESQGPAFVPADAIAYVEARLDMPGGQADAVAEMMTAFPGFADPGSFDMKMDEIIGGLGSELGVAMPDGDLIGDVLTGELGLGLGDIESLMMGGEPSMVIGLAVADAEVADTVMDALIADSVEPMTESTYNDVTIHTDAGSSPPMSVALHGDWMIMGTGEAMVQSSIDVLDGTAPGLADEADFAAAWSRLPDSRLGGAYVDFSAFASLIDMGMMMAEGETGMAIPTEDLAALLPIDMVASLAAENDRIHLQTFITPGPGMPDFAVGDSDLAMSFPADTQVYLETRDLGANVQTALDQLVEMMAAQEMGAMDDAMGMEMGLGDIEMLIGEESPITALLGVPLPEFLDFVGDTGVGAGLSSDGLWLGIAGNLLDPTTAQERVSSLMTIMRMAVLSEDSGMSMDSSEVAGVEVTTITLPIDAMLAESGVPMGIGDSIDVAVTDDTLLIGLGDFVENAIIADPADSLGNSAGYTDAIADDTSNAGEMYVNISSLLAALDPMLSMMAPEWAEIAPYATGLDRMVAVGTADDEVLGGRMTVIVGQ